MSTMTELESKIAALSHGQYMELMDSVSTDEEKATIRAIRWKAEFKDAERSGIYPRGDDGPMPTSQVDLWGHQ